MAASDLLRVLFASYPAGEYQIDTIELSHSLFTQRYFFTRETGGLTATITNEDTSTEIVNFEGVNIEVVLNQKKSDLDSNFSFTFADPDNLLDDEIENIPLSDTEKIKCVYRSYISTDLTEEAELHRLEVLSINQQKGRFTIDVGVQQLNWQKTGIIYDYDTFPMLRALL